MHRSTQSALASALLFVSFLAGCAGTHNSPTIPSTSASQPSGPARQRKDIGPADMHAGGGAFPMYAYNGNVQPTGSASNLNQPQPTVTSLFFNYPSQTANIYYCETGSDFGKSVFTGANTAGSTSDCAALGLPPLGFGGRVDPPDFAGTDVAFRPTDEASFKVNRALQDHPVEFPAMAGPIDFVYNAGDLTGLSGRLKLSRWTYCAITNGTITDWNDAAITADNGGSVTGGTSLPLTYVFRSDADGTNLSLQRHLQAVCGTYWRGTYGKAPYQSTGRSAAWPGGTPTETWTGPTTGNFTGAYGPDAQISSITSTPGGTGAADGPLAVAQGLTAALLQDRAAYNGASSAPKFVDPTSLSALQKGIQQIYLVPGQSDAGNVQSTRQYCIAYVPYQFYVDGSSPGAYPIMEISYLLAYGKNNDHFSDLMTLLKYINTNSGSSPAPGTADAIVEQSGYVPMPYGVKAYVQNYVLNTHSGCISS